jgi:hypothetical protein
MNSLRTQKVGRPTVINEDILRKLEAGLATGFSISTACHFAGISTSTFYEHKALDKEFSDRVRWAEEWATYKARQVIIKAIEDGNVDAAKWYLSRKARTEFSANKPI